MSRARAVGRRSLVDWLAVGVWCAVTLLVWFGYHAVREWQASSAQLEQRRMSDAAELLVTALARDMRGVQDSVLRSSEWTDTMLDPPYDIGTVLAGAFARYPYPESFFGWRGRPAAGRIVFFHRSNRPPAWSATVEKSERFPITVAQDEAAATVLAARIRHDCEKGREQSIFEIRLHGEPYQVVTRLLYDDPFHEQPRGGLGFTVNLDWVRRSYFPELARQVSRIGPAAGGLLLSIVDDHGTPVTERTPASSGRMSERRFPLLFADPLLVAIDQPPDLPRREWAVLAAAADDSRMLHALPFTDAIRTFFVVAFTAGILAVGLAMTARAARASARLADMRSDFVATMTHELKTPLATIRAIGDTVASGRVVNGEMVREYAQLVVQESKRLTRLVDNSLTYARVTDVAEVYHFDPLKVGALLDEAVHGFESQLKARDFVVEMDVEPGLAPIRADRTAVGLLLDNLIDNAVRYSGDSRWIGIQATAHDSCVRIVIRDRGIGVPPDELQHVVKKFARARNAGPGGSGLGLAIVNRIAIAHGGRLMLDSTAQGTTATVDLPAADRHAQTNSGRRG